jgi:hypothetical protein
MGTKCGIVGINTAVNERKLLVVTRFNLCGFKISWCCRRGTTNIFDVTIFDGFSGIVARKQQYPSCRDVAGIDETRSNYYCKFRCSQHLFKLLLDGSVGNFYLQLVIWIRQVLKERHVKYFLTSFGIKIQRCFHKKFCLLFFIRKKQ